MIEIVLNESNPRIIAIHADNMDLLPYYDNKIFDLVIADPPYAINATSYRNGTNTNRKDQKGGVSTTVKLKGRLNSGGGKLKNRKLNSTDIDWDNEIPSDDYFSHVFRVSNNQIFFGGNYFPLPPTGGIGFWDKLQPWENFSQFELIWTSYDCPAFKIALSNTGGANNKKKVHPTEKPIALYQNLFKRFAKPNMTCLDTHGGSGNIAVAAFLMGVNLTIIEKSEIHFTDLVANYKECLKDPFLFPAEELFYGDQKSLF